MTRGRWVLLAILLVGAGMGLASWPLLAVRRKGDIRTTEKMLDTLLQSCERHRERHGSYPETLGDPRDAWGRPIAYEFTPAAGAETGRLGRGIRVRSLGPNPHDPSDDIVRSRP